MKYSDVKYIYPWNPFWAKGMVISNPALLIQGGNGTTLEVIASGGRHYCLDYFHPVIYNFVKGYLTAEVLLDRALWLGGDIPYLQTVGYSISADKYKNLPFYPGGKASTAYADTLPFDAKHVVHMQDGTPVYQDHFNVHGMFGAAVANVTRYGLPETSFAISGSTFAGMGQYGVAHVFNRQNATWATLNYTISNILNFNMFGIPTSGGNLCGVQPATNNRTE